jgi:hypothetical protein
MELYLEALNCEKEPLDGTSPAKSLYERSLQKFESIAGLNNMLPSPINPS